LPRIFSSAKAQCVVADITNNPILQAGFEQFATDFTKINISSNAG